MYIVNFILAIVALIIAILAFQKGGGPKDLREKTADTLAKMEAALRKIEQKTDPES